MFQVKFEAMRHTKHVGRMNALQTSEDDETFVLLVEIVE